MDFFGSLEQVAKVAFYEASFGAIFVSGAWPSVAIIYGAQSNPGELWEAAGKWGDVADRLSDASDEVDAQLKTLSESDWSGKDRDAFEKQLNDYQNQIWLSRAFAWCMQMILKLMTLLISAFIIMMAVLATILMGFAVAIIALWVVSKIPFPPTKAAAEAALASVKAASTAFSIKMRAMLRAGEKALTSAGNAAAGTIAGLMAIDVMGQMLTGNTRAYGDFVQATVKSADDVVAGRLSLLEQKLTGQLMRGYTVGGLKIGNKMVLPIQRIPQQMRPWIQPGTAFTKGFADVGMPLAGTDPDSPIQVNENSPLPGGSPSMTRPLTDAAAKYGEDGSEYVGGSDALPGNVAPKGGS
ncbi:WXG100 family type VII secretion target [Actinomadura sp. 9N407]|uniref:WXG100 family type VII secretion target n=1 Tax=Actinomadura sp. 9N407 TaxID=3375154 RepID=UPI003796A448